MMNSEIAKEQEKNTEVIFVEDDLTRIGVLFGQIAEHDIKDCSPVVALSVDDIKMQLNHHVDPVLIVIDMRMERSRRNAVVKYLAENNTNVLVVFTNASFAERTKPNIEGMSSLNYKFHDGEPLHYSALMKLIAGAKKDKK